MKHYRLNKVAKQNGVVLKMKVVLASIPSRRLKMPALIPIARCAKSFRRARRSVQSPKTTGASGVPL